MVESIKDTENALNTSLIENLVMNAKEQNQNDRLVEYAPLFHMERIIALDEQILLLKKPVPFMAQIMYTESLKKGMAGIH